LVKGAGYLGGRNVQLAYNIKSDVFKKTYFSSARIYITANNLFTFTKYKGFNPDATVADNNVLNSGQAQSNYPVARSFVIGFNLTF